MPCLRQTAQGASLPRAADTVFAYGHWNAASIDSLIKAARGEPAAAKRLVLLSGAFAGTPYKANTLSAGPEKPEELVVNLKEMDCFTFLDYLLALTFASDHKSFIAGLSKIRYEHSIVQYERRNHFFSLWIANNGLRLTDVTRQFPSAVCSTKSLNKNGDSLRLRRIPIVKREVCFILAGKIGSIDSLPLKDGDLLGFHTPKEGLDVTHVGLAVRIGGQWFLRHASSMRNKVLDEPLEAYVKGKRGCDGIIVARLNPEKGLLPDDDGGRLAPAAGLNSQ